MSQRQDDSVERQWILLLDETWSSQTTDGGQAPPEEDGVAGSPPVESIVGGWLVNEDGTVGAFEPNPLYEPSGAAPASPVDAAAELYLTDRAGPELILSAMRESFTEIALDEADEVIVAGAPDGAPCVLVASSVADRTRVAAPRWRQVDHAGLLALLPEGVDVLLNPGGPRSMRLFASALRQTAGPAR